MSFALLDDRLLEHPKFATLPDDAWALWVRALIFANRYRTDGRLDRATLTTLRAKPKVVRELVARRIWDADRAGAYVIHDFLAYNFDKHGRKPARPVPTARHVPPDLHAKRADAGRRGAERRWGDNDGKDPTDSKPDSKPDAHDIANDGKTDGKNDGPVFPRSQDPKIPIQIKSRAREESFAKAGDFFAPLLHALKTPEGNQ